MISSKTLVLALAGAACLVAAGTGGYLAVRTNSPGQPVAAAPSASAPAPTLGTSVAVEPPAAQSARPPARTDAREARKAIAPARTAVVSPKAASGSPADTSANRSASSTPILTSPPVPPPAADVPLVAAPPIPEIAPTPVPELPKPRFEELTVKADSVIGIRLDSAVTSETARVEDKVTARVSRDVTVDERTAIPAGARLEGNVTFVERGGKFKERARLGVRFTTLVLADGATRLPIDTETIFRDGDSPTSESASRIGASAVVGAILGAVVGGKKGAAIGGTAGAAGGTAAVMAGGRNHATMAAGTALTVRLTAPVTVLVERDPR